MSRRKPCKEVSFPSLRATVKHHKTGLATLISIPYSEHSSFAELQQLVKDIKHSQEHEPRYISTVGSQECLKLLGV